MTPDPSRREFLGQGAAAFGAGWLAANWPAILQAAEHASVARAQARKLAVLAAEDALDLESIAARILPTTDTPGAREIGVIHFIDQALGGFMAGMENMLRPELGALNASAAARYGTQRFHQLADGDQDRLLREIEDQAFFQTMRLLTLMGAFAMPEHGGNREHLGWALLGFDHRHLWRPPFGHYDAPHHERAPSRRAPAAADRGHHHGS